MTAPDRLLHRWHSPHTGRVMPVARYGWWGRPVIWFPTGGGHYLDGESFGIVGALAPLIEAGRVKLYLVDSVDREAWTNPDVPALEKPRRQAAYDGYLREELFPWIRWDCGGTTDPLVVTGASLGGYNALNAACKHPDQVGVMIGMSGTYQLNRRMGSEWSEDWYYNDPVQFVPNLPEGEQLEQLRRVRFVFGLGQNYENPAYTWTVADVLGKRGVWNRVEVWGADSGHDWPTWRTMLPLFLGKLGV